MPVQHWRALTAQQRMLAKSVRLAVRKWRGRTRATIFSAWREETAAVAAAECSVLLAAACACRFAANTFHDSMLHMMSRCPRCDLERSG